MLIVGHASPIWSTIAAGHVRICLCFLSSSYFLIQKQKKNPHICARCSHTNPEMCYPRRSTPMAAAWTDRMVVMAAA
jgi:hypothetical protein